jgi:hypothetical protein
MHRTFKPRTIVARAAVALTMSLLTGATAGAALARWPVTRPTPSA